MKQRIDIIKDEIMKAVTGAPEAMHSVGGLCERFGKKVKRPEVERAVACLLGNQHIKKLGGYVFGLGTGEGIKPYSFDNYDPFALSNMAEPEPETTPKAPPQQKSMQNWSTGNKPPKAAPAASEAETTPPAEQPRSATINHALDELRQKLTHRHQVRELALKLNTLDQLAQMCGPDISKVLQEISDDLKTGAAA